MDRAHLKDTKKRMKVKRQDGQMQSALLNLRQMYDQSIMERDRLQSEILHRDQVLTAACIDQELIIPVENQTAVQAGLWDGYKVDIDEETGAFVLTAIKKEETDDEGNENDELDGGTEGTEDGEA